VRAIYVIAVGLALSGGALAQNQNTGKTGTGNAFETLEALQTEIRKYSDSRFGQFVKGAAGLAGIASALSVASDAVNFRIRADGSVVPGGSGSGSSSGSTSTSTVISSSSSTN